jgi:hypothetical protein
LHLALATVGTVAAVRLVALGVALAFTGWLTAVAPTRPAPEPATLTDVRKLAQVWPSARIATSPVRLPDGTDYTPQLYLTADTSIGTAPGAGTTRLVLRRGADPPRELRQALEFAAFTTDGSQVYWAETSAGADGRAVTSLWRADPVVQLVPDAGPAMFATSQYALQVAAGSLHWITAGPDDQNTTGLRSVPAAGGAVGVRPLPGLFALSAWPWLVSTSSARGPLDLLDIDTGQRVRVPVAAAETAVCGPTWCRLRVVTQSGVSRLDLMRPDGSDRHRIAGGTFTASAPDVALLDRFEVMSGGDRVRSLRLYDEKRRTIVAVADDATGITARDGKLWWSSAGSWHVLDLATLQ